MFWAPVPPPNGSICPGGATRFRLVPACKVRQWLWPYRLTFGGRAMPSQRLQQSTHLSLRHFSRSGGGSAYTSAGAQAAGSGALLVSAVPVATGDVACRDVTQDYQCTSGFGCCCPGGTAWGLLQQQRESGTIDRPRGGLFWPFTCQSGDEGHLGRCQSPYQHAQDRDG